MQQQEAEAITNEAGGGCSARRNLNAPFTELCRTGQEAAKTELFESMAARHYARQHAGPAGRNLTDLKLPVQRANYLCSENSLTSVSFCLDLLTIDKIIGALKKTCIDLFQCKDVHCRG